MNTDQTLKIVNTLADSAKAGMYPRVDGQILVDARSLIESQLREIAGLNSALETLRGVAESYEHYNENLKRENAYLRERLAEEMEHKEDCFFSVDFDIKSLKADTVKKMQERLKERMCDIPTKYCTRTDYSLSYRLGDWVDDISKEILEGGDTE